MRDEKNHRPQATGWLIARRPLRFIAPRYVRGWAILNEVKNLARRFKAACNLRPTTCLPRCEALRGDLRPAICDPRQATCKGFTLMELIIVIAVIAILIGIAIPGFFGMLTEAHITQASGDLRTIKTSIESYFMHQSPPAYPTAGTTWETQLTTAIPKILPEILYDPFGTSDETEYIYTLSTNGLYYVINSLGPDAEADITGITDTGTLTGIQDDDIFVTNGAGF